MSKLRVRVKDVNRITEVRAALKELKKYALEIGIFSESGGDYVMIAAVHEFGVTIRQQKGVVVIPERSFIRSTFDEKENDWYEFLKKDIMKVISLELDARTAWERLGTRIVADIQRKITEIKDPPNAPSTIAKKGSSNPLIDTGGLRKRITYKVVDAKRG